MADGGTFQPHGIALRIENLSHSYRIEGRALPVLENISLDLKPGEFVSLLGTSGCGKSTLLRLIAGLEPPLEGRIVAGETDVTAPDRSRILVFQDPTLFPWRTVRRNVALGLETDGSAARRGDEIDAALRLVQLEAFAEAFPHQLSGGMAQRVALARALINHPPLLLLDEPLGKLDALTRLSMQSELLHLWRKVGFSAVLVTHDVEEALLLSDRVIVLSDRPAQIVAELPVALPHPRHRDDPKLVALRAKVLALLGADIPEMIA
ncbi:ABC transporter ATP-binding protein [Rhodobacter capsulatus]|uniref:ABC transporter ATP-binding protein n=1 Tax=Rhodobacter capsulatus TaxID=1061 RepID=A0A4U1JM80_RHOCA|nr:ABC transporter ATP-binding protein [Rhodobacter capsulatus]TKD14549.1 ABC transporter ATP-binding protein [Rhodobacter capsulatus]